MSVELHHAIEIRKDGKWQLMKWYTTTPSWYNKEHREHHPWMETWSYLKNYSKHKKFFKDDDQYLHRIAYIKRIFKEAMEEEVPHYDKPIKVNGQTMYPQAVLDINNLLFRDYHITSHGNIPLGHRGIPSDCSEELKQYINSKWDHSFTNYTMSELWNLCETEHEKLVKKVKNHTDNETLLAIAKQVGVKGTKNVYEDYTFEEWFDEVEENYYGLRMMAERLTGVIETLTDMYYESDDIRVITWAS